MKQFFIILIFLFSFASPVLAVTDCPFGLVNDPEPQCGRWIDSNNDGLCDHSQEELTKAAVISPSEASVEPTVITVTNIESVNTKKVAPYNFFDVILVILILYILSLVLVETKIITKLLYKKAWNILLLLSFVICALSGILLIIQINYGLKFNTLPFSLLYQHVEWGLVFSLIALLHVAERFYFFRRLITK